MKNSRKVILTAVFVSTLGVAGLAQSVHAKYSSTVMSQTHSTQVAQASSNADQAADDAQDEQEAAKYQNLAKITPDQAQKAAEAAVKGKASSVKLENEDGNLIYEVVIGKKEIAVDVGNGKVLYTSIRFS
jgi:uncharacterized membrane protein YkoI